MITTLALSFLALLLITAIYDAKRRRHARNTQPQTTADVIDVRGWKTFRARREEQGIA